MKKPSGNDAAAAAALSEDPSRFVSLVSSCQIRLTKALLKTLLSKTTSSALAEAAARSIRQGLENLDNLSSAPEENPAGAPEAGFQTPPPPPTRRKRKRGASEQAAEEAEAARVNCPSGRNRVVSGLKGCVTVVQAGLTHCPKWFNPGVLLSTVQSLHDRLVVLEEDPELQESISELCELWWREGLDGRESLIAQSLPFLMSRTLTSNRKVDVHRVHSMREAFTLFDFHDPSIEDLKHLLIRSVVTPLFLRAAEGRRFCSFLFGLSPQLVKEISALMHSQIPFGRKSILEAYGEILYRAWKGAGGACLDEVEQTCVQGLIEGAVYASSKTLSSACRKVLEGFISQRAENGVEAMLFRLQEPILFRSLQVANSNVRRNAFLLLVDMFPLQDPDSSKEGKEVLFEKQFLLIEKLLDDPCPDVRSTAVEGACRVLRLFWEVVPSLTAAKLLTRLVDDMANDQGSSTTRLAVLQGVTYLLENSQSHEILKVLLPRLSSMLNDPALNVRAAVVDLLLAVKDIRGIPFHKVVRLDTLLSVLANDCEAVARRITNLLIPSYFPKKSPVPEACNRCCTLIQRSPLAGARFCSLIFAEEVAAESLFELIKFLCNLVLSESDLDNDHREGILLALTELGSAMASSAQWKRTLGEYLTGNKLMALLKAATSLRARTAVVRLATSLPPKDVPELTKYCGDLVSTSAKDLAFLESSDEIKAVNSFVLAWGGFDDLVHALLDRLSRFCLAERQSSSKRKVKASRTKTRSSPRQASVKGTFAAAVGAAWHVQNLLAESDTRNALLACDILQDLLARLKQLAEYCMKNVRSIDQPRVISSTVTAYANLTIHLSLERKKDSNIRTSTGRKKRHRVDVSTATPVSNPSDGLERAFEELIDWAAEMIEGVKPCLETRGKDTQVSARAIKLASATLRSVLEALTLGLAADSALQSNAIRLAATFISSLQAGIQGNVLLDVLQELLPCLKASVSYAGKLLAVCTGHPQEVSSLGHALLDILANIGQLGAESEYQLLPAMRPWIPDALAAVAEKLFSEDLASRVWLSHLATVSSENHDRASKEESAGSSSESERTCGALLQVVTKALPKLSEQVRQAFVGQLLQHTVRSFEDSDHERGIDFLTLICRTVLDCKLKGELSVDVLTGLREIDSRLSDTDFPDTDRLEAARKLVQEVLPPPCI